MIKKIHVIKIKPSVKDSVEYPGHKVLISTYWLFGFVPIYKSESLLRV